LSTIDGTKNHGKERRVFIRFLIHFLNWMEGFVFSLSPGFGWEAMDFSGSANMQTPRRFRSSLGASAVFPLTQMGDFDILASSSSYPTRKRACSQLALEILEDL